MQNGKKKKHMEDKQYATRQPVSYWKQSKRKFKNTKRQMKMEPHNKSKLMGQSRSCCKRDKLENKKYTNKQSNLTSRETRKRRTNKIQH